MEHTPAEDAASDARVRAMSVAFLETSARVGATREDALRAALGLLLGVARDCRATRKQLVDLVDLQARDYLTATAAGLQAKGVELIRATGRPG